MLFDVTAILTLVALGPAAEAIAAPQNAVVAASTPFIGPTPDLGPTPPELGPQPGLGPDLQVTTLTGIQLLQQLIYLTPSQIEEFVDARPDAIRDLLAQPPVARDVTLWWGSLTPAVRGGLLEASPELIGNLDGIPFEVQDGANREFLDQTMRDLRAVIASDVGRTMIDHAEQQLNMLEAIADSLQATGTNPTSTDPTSTAPTSTDPTSTDPTRDGSGRR